MHTRGSSGGGRPLRVSLPQNQASSHLLNPSEGLTSWMYEAKLAFLCPRRPGVLGDGLLSKEHALSFFALTRRSERVECRSHCALFTSGDDESRALARHRPEPGIVVAVGLPSPDRSGPAPRPRVPSGPHVWGGSVRRTRFACRDEARPSRLNRRELGAHRYVVPFCARFGEFLARDSC